MYPCLFILARPADAASFSEVTTWLCHLCSFMESRAVTAKLKALGTSRKWEAAMEILKQLPKQGLEVGDVENADKKLDIYFKGFIF